MRPDERAPAYSADTSDLRWVAKALRQDGVREALHYAAIFNWGGTVVVCACDAHRAHILRLGKAAADCPLEPASRDDQFLTQKARLLDLPRVLHWAEYERATTVELDGGLTEVRVGRAPRSMEPVPGKVWVEVMSYPNPLTVVPATRQPVTRPFRVKSYYLAEALELAGPNASAAVLFGGAGDGEEAPVAFQSEVEECRWLAVIKPMCKPQTGWAGFFGSEVRL